MTTFTPEIVKLIRAEQKRQNRRKALGKFASGLVVSAALTLTHGLLLMLAVGVAHAEWIPSLPTVGYAVAYAVADSWRWTADRLIHHLATA